MKQSLAQRVGMFLRSPQGQRLIAHGRRELAKPANQQRLRRLLSRLSGRR